MFSLGLNNILIDQSIIQLLYNVAHWVLGVNIVLFAYFEFKKSRSKSMHRRAKLIGPAVFLLNGIFFVSFVLIGHLLYIYLMKLPWQFDHEHLIHLYIGLAMTIGGTAELGYRTKHFRNSVWHYVLPATFTVSGLLFLHPQHGLGSVLEYMTLYHQVLAYSLILGGLGLALAWKIARNKYLLYLALGIVAFSGFVFIAYRHQYNAQANCLSPEFTVHDIHFIDGKVEPAFVEATLCDKIRFIASDNKPHFVAFGGHSHHSSYPEFEERLLEPNQELSLQVSLSGKFKFHDHLNENQRGEILIQRPKNLSNWTVDKY